ncbi:hypothetical protein ARMGADRAFT_76360 [Armillaria gallica]|uniref:Uncharacterized protein n=1 Tax=Armillaria gallica TaxID=47427 RepID=A0A2H3CGM6_ARMGA|nr:hypothetical protein ARMGADRAFT_76360 [Armillaria gallica]
MKYVTLTYQSHFIHQEMSFLPFRRCHFESFLRKREDFVCLSDYYEWRCTCLCFLDDFLRIWLESGISTRRSSSLLILHLCQAATIAIMEVTYVQSERRYYYIQTSLPSLERQMWRPLFGPSPEYDAHARVTISPACQTAHGSPCNHHNGQFINRIQGADIIAVLLVGDALIYH